jgi:MFS family permease
MVTETKPSMGHIEGRNASFDRTDTIVGPETDAEKGHNQTTSTYDPKSPEGYYRNFEPIAELGLEDWRATEKALVRRLDLTLLPTLWILYLNNYLDRTNIAQARLNGMDRDIGLTGDDYNLAVSILTIGYMLAQLPSNMLLTRVRPSIYLPVTCIVWSSVAIATSGVKNAQHLFVVRFFLGILEAPLFPGVSCILSGGFKVLTKQAVFLMNCWYTRKEIALRTAILYSGLVLAQAFSGILASGIFSGMSGVAGLYGWQWLFIIESLMSTVCGIAAFFTLPDYPHSKTGSARWVLNNDTRRLAEARIIADRVTGATGTGSLKHGLMLAVTDFKTWFFVCPSTFVKRV